MSKFLARGHRYQATKTFAQISLLAIWGAIAAIGAGVLAFAWFIS